MVQTKVKSCGENIKFLLILVMLSIIHNIDIYIVLHVLLLCVSPFNGMRRSTTEIYF